MTFIRSFRETGLGDVALVGGKNASLGEMLAKLTPLGVRVPDGFAVTADGYRHFLAATPASKRPSGESSRGVDKSDVDDLVRRGETASAS